LIISYRKIARRHEMKNLIVGLFIGACLSVNPVFAREAGKARIDGLEGDVTAPGHETWIESRSESSGSSTDKGTDIKAKESSKQKKPAKKKSKKVDKLDGEAVDVDHGTWSDIKTDDSPIVRDKGGKK